MIIANTWEFEEKDIVTIVTMAGEYVGRLKFVDRPNTVRIEEPRLLLNDGQGGQQFVATVSMTGENNPKYVDFNRANVITILKTHEDYAKAYVQATSGLVVASGKL